MYKFQDYIISFKNHGLFRNCFQAQFPIFITKNLRKLVSQKKKKTIFYFLLLKIENKAFSLYFNRFLLFFTYLLRVG